MKNIIFTSCLFIIIQNAFGKDEYNASCVNHTLNLSYGCQSGQNGVIYLPANIGDSVSLSEHFNCGYTGCGTWYFSLSFIPWNSGPWDSIPNSFGANPFNFIVTKYGTYQPFAFMGHEFIIIPAVPPIPNPIIGITAGTCNRNYVHYTTSLPTGYNATFNWTVPPGAYIYSGQGTNSILVNYLPNAEISGTISVTAVTIYGSSPIQTLSITTNPPVPGSIWGPHTVCAHSFGNVYSIAPALSATSYEWVGPPGCHISAGINTSAGNSLFTTSASVSVNFATITTSSVLKVRAFNNCNGSSKFRSLSLIPCNPRIASGESELFHNISSLKVFPIQDNSTVTIQLNSAKPIDIEIAFIDMNGKQLKASFYKNVVGEFIKNENTEALTKGIYIVEIKTENEIINKKLILL
jgi:hypothetical protein